MYVQLKDNIHTSSLSQLYADCPEGLYGQDCLGVCLCQNNASCDLITGMCNCTIGWTGPACGMSKL